MTEASVLVAPTIAMCPSGFAGAPNVNRAVRAGALSAGPVYIQAQARQSSWPMFARFLRVMAAGRPGEGLRGAMHKAAIPAVRDGEARAAAAASSGVSSVSSGATFSLAPSGGREESR